MKTSMTQTPNKTQKGLTKNAGVPVLLVCLGLIGGVGIVLLASSFSARGLSQEQENLSPQNQPGLDSHMSANPKTPPPNMPVGVGLGAEGFAPKVNRLGVDVLPGAPQTGAVSSSGVGVEPLGLQRTDFIYDPTGLRDPFRPFFANKFAMVPTTPSNSMPTNTGAGKILKPAVEVLSDPLESFDLAQLKVVAIIWSAKNSRVVIKDPTGKLHHLKTNAKLGRSQGVISEIKEGGIVVVERFMEGAGAAVNKTFIPVSK